MEKLTDMYRKLQNGSDVRGIALEGVEGEKVNLTPEIAENIAEAFAVCLREEKGKDGVLRVGVGHDSRLSTDILMGGVIRGLSNAGVKVYDCGLTSTPSMFMSTVLDGFGYDGSVMITASHLPFNRNGLKFFTSEGGFEGSDIRWVLDRAAEIAEKKNSGAAAPSDSAPEVEKADLVGAYTAYMQNLIREEVNADDYEHPLEGLHIVVDASNGVGGYFVHVLEPLGASTEGSICLNPDGTFPVHIPNPENEKAMNTIRTAVLDSRADLGVIFDTDGDRAAVVFSNGEEVNRNRIIALMAAIVSQKFPHTTVVTDSVTSDHLREFIEGHLGMKHHRFKRGYKNVINEAIRLNGEGVETHLAMETSGHGALKENYFLDDGAYLSVRIISQLAICRREGRKIEELIADLGEPKESSEKRYQITAEDFRAYGTKLLEDFRAFARSQETFHIVEPNYEGIRVSFDDPEVKGWMLIRMSLHDPVIVMNFEAEEEGGIAVIQNRLKTFFEPYTELK